jgi:hypothetical protein
MKKWMMWVGFSVLAIAIIFPLCWMGYTNKLSYTLDFGSIIDAFVLLLVFTIIDYHYSKESSQKRADTDLLLRTVEQASEAFRHLEEQSRACEQDHVLGESQQVGITCAERELSNCVHSIEVALSHCGVQLHSVDFQRLKDARDELKESLTDTPFPGPYDRRDRTRIRSALKSMRDELTRVSFAINRR